MSIKIKLAAATLAVMALPALIAVTGADAQAASRGFYRAGVASTMMARPTIVRPLRPMVVGTPCRHGHGMAIPRPADPYRGGAVSHVPPHPRQRPCLAS